MMKISPSPPAMARRSNNISRWLPSFPLLLTLLFLMVLPSSSTSFVLPTSTTAIVVNPLKPLKRLSLPRRKRRSKQAVVVPPPPPPPALKDATTAVVEPDDASSSGGDATIPEEIFNLVKSIVGVGVLSLPAGIAAFGNAKSAALPAMVLIAVIGALSGYGFLLTGRVCKLSKTTSFRQAWSKTTSPSTAWIPAVSVTLQTLSAVLAYSMVLGDTFSSLAASVGWHAITRTKALLGITGLVLLPLCLLKNLSSLAPFSLVGSLGMVYTSIAMAIRYFDKSYLLTGGSGGKFVADVAPSLQASFGNKGARSVFSPQATILISMLSTAYMAHFNAPKFYLELRDNTIPRFTQVVSWSFAISIMLFAVMATLGFWTFGSACSGLILNNYSTRDTYMGLSRIAVAISLVFSYPLAFVGAREGLLDLFQISNLGGTKQTMFTALLLAAVTVAALVLQDVSLVLALAGATLGNALIYVFPAVMFRGAVKKSKTENKALAREVPFAMACALLGIAMGALGTKMALSQG